MPLLTSKVPRSLETKSRLFGFELPDLLLIFLYLALSNLIFGKTRLKFPLVWVGTGALAATLHLTKRGKPEGYLQHRGEFQRMPSILSVGVPDLEFMPYRGVPRAEEKGVPHE